MKKIIAIILSLVSLLALPTNCSFAKEIQPAETSKHTASVGKNNDTRKKSQREKTIENLKRNLKNYNEKHQKLIQKYKSMTDEQFNRFAFLITFLWSFIWCTIGSIIGSTIGSLIGKSIDESYEAGYIDGKKIGRQLGYFEGKISQEDSYMIKFINRDSGFLSDTRALVRKLLATLHPDSFHKKGNGKSFDDVKELYYTATNFYDNHFK